MIDLEFLCYLLRERLHNERIEINTGIPYLLLPSGKRAQLFKEYSGISIPNCYIIEGQEGTMHVYRYLRMA